MQERAVPALVDIIRAPETHSAVLLEGALDLLAVLLRPSAPEQAAGVHAAASSHVMALALHQDDAGILQSCSEYLRWPPHPRQLQTAAYGRAVQDLNMMTHWQDVADAKLMPGQQLPSFVDESCLQTVPVSHGTLDLVDSWGLRHCCSAAPTSASHKGLRSLYAR